MGWLSSASEFAQEAGSIALEATEVVPFAGTAVNAAEGMYDIGKAEYDDMEGNRAAVDNDFGAAELHMIEAIPVVGTGVGTYKATNDLLNEEGATAKQFGLSDYTDSEAEKHDEDKERDRERMRSYRE